MRRLLLVLLPLGAVSLGLMLALATVAVRDALAAADQVEHARAGLEEARSSGSDLPAVSMALVDAGAALDRAQDRLDGPASRIAAALPVLGRSFAAERAVVRAASSAVAGLTVAVSAAPDLRQGAGLDVRRLDALGQDLSGAAARAEVDLAALRSVRTGLTPGRVGDAVEEARGALDPVVAGLRAGSDGASLTARLLGLDAPRRVLVALQNNAELRGTGGYVSTFATGTLAEGRLQLEPFRDVLDVSDPPGGARKVPAPEEFVEDYGVFLADTTLWREWTMTPDVPDAAAVTAEVADLQLGGRPDVVLMLDVPALAAVVRLAGQDVVLPGGVAVPPDRLADALLVDTYARAGAGAAEQTRRRAELRAAAGATVADLLAGQLDPVRTAQELGRLARGRHLAVWSTGPAEQARLEALGLSGSADPQGDDLALVSLNNVNANKLDRYVDRAVRVEATVGPTTAEVTQTVVLTNRAPEGLVPYVAGEQTPGTVVHRVEFSLSPRASFGSLRRDGKATTGDVRTGGERTRVHTFVTLPRGATAEVAVRYDVPLQEGRYRLRLLPQPLAQDAALEVSVRAADGLRLIDVAGAALVHGRAQRRGPWAESELLDVVAAPQTASMWDKLSQRVGLS